ncbi:galactonate dehydratase [Asticcacaulis sp.]|uniref:galactonate dehydratase n=1 Tax=Asticcacaulis sp. TaxID=1872648 RepID=UPI002BE75652|nr:galactonate dehydratase [Asticcacaulis sp.]HTM81621.1 galactonate dehydratase [Asticcacaulis sp.]
MQTSPPKISADVSGIALPVSPHASKILRIETFPVPPRWLFVRVETSDGLVGWGEASLEGHSEAVAGAYASLRDRFLDFDADRIEDVWQTAYRLGFYRGGPVLMSALSGLDQALWDIKGKRYGVPIHQLLGGRVRDRVGVYAWVGGDRPSDVLDAAKVRISQGFKSVKMNATEDSGWLDSPRSLDAVAQRLADVQSLGIDAGLDFHGRLHKPMAKQLAHILEPLRPLFIEEPLLSEHPEAIKQLSLLTNIPIAMGERMYSRWDLKPFLEAASIDILQPDLSHAGGISEVKRMAAMAEAYDVALAPHCPLGPIALSACIQLGLATPNFAIQEMSLGIHYNTDGHDLLAYVKNPSVFDVKDGMIEAITGPGLGIIVDEDKVRELSRDCPPWRNPAWRGPDGYVREW